MISETAYVAMEESSGTPVPTPGRDRPIWLKRATDIAAATSGHDRVCVFASYRKIDPSLVRILQRLKKPFGILPVLDLEDLPWHKSTVGDSAGRGPLKRSPVVAAYVSRMAANAGAAVSDETVRHRVERLGGEYVRLPDRGRKELVRSVLRHREIDIFGIVTDGRQTYCNMAGNCLHPFKSDVERGILAPVDVRARHYLIQSCHSPYTWPDFGDYRSLPVSLLVGSPVTRSVICSCRVQSIIPRVLDLYLRLTLEGTALGDVVLALNGYVNECGYDWNPFLLLGDPSWAAVRRARGPSVLGGRDERAGHDVSCANLATLGRMLSNLQFLLFRYHFRFDKCGAKCSNLSSRLDNWLRRDVLPKYHDRVARQVQNKASNLEEAWEWLQLGGRAAEAARGQESSLRRVSEGVNRMFLMAGGYYYHLGPELEKSYRTYSAREAEGGAGEDEERDAAQYRHKREYVGAYGGSGKNARVCWIGDRELVFRDVASEMERLLSCREENGTYVFEFENRTAEGRWVFGSVACTDPNNVSRSTAPELYDRLLCGLELRGSASAARYRAPQPGLAQAAVFPAREVPPGGIYRMEIEVELKDKRRPLFYLLVEACIFVDFVWNWMSITRRAKDIEAWLASEEYAMSLPGARR